MTKKATNASTATGGKSKTSAPTKLETIAKLLCRKNGASLAELEKATKWQPHSVRAALSGLRKRGTSITRERAADGRARYKIAQGA